MITTPFHILLLSSELNCRRLLQTSSSTASYKCLAMALYESVICGTLWASKKKDLADEDSESTQRRVNDLVLNEGTKSILKTVNFELHVQEPFFTQLEDGLKTIEGSCAVGDNNRMAPGAAILFNKCVASGLGDDDFIQTSYSFFMEFGFLIAFSQQNIHRHASFL
ncbi:hypothetical protein DKX38_026350 [Salix brachista]|uniref:Uncharacterized protein n=1 Tax=Salix brachista TaxID=2182728 RepID=A0A5N5JAB7_9ROSI|nr:hypothetical protein DKX38_026350 [Salix brachista]